jgi:hypothetical protein
LAVSIGEFDSFPTFADFLLTAVEDMDRSTVASFKQHLQDLHSQLGIYFPELDTSFEWIRNPFGDKTHNEQVSSKLSPKEIDSLCIRWDNENNFQGERIDRLLAPHPA